MNPSGDFSVSAWVKLTNSSKYRSAVTSRSETVNGNQTGGYMLYISSANRWQFWNGHGDTEGFWAQVNADERIVENTWHMQTVTYDHSATTMKLYVDGVFLEENTSETLLANTDKPLYIGAGRTNKHPHDALPPQFYFNGNIDDVAIWNTTLSAAEIVQYIIRVKLYMLVIIMEIIHLQDHCKSIGQWIAKSVVKTTVQVQHYLEKEIIMTEHLLILQIGTHLTILEQIQHYHLQVQWTMKQAY